MQRARRGSLAGLFLSLMIHSSPCPVWRSRLDIWSWAANFPQRARCKAAYAERSNALVPLPASELMAYRGCMQ